MSTEIHAHSVLNLLKEEAMTPSVLRERVESEFGENAAFRTCKREGFDLDSLITFFLEREKVVEREGVLHINLERVCNHG